MSGTLAPGGIIWVCTDCYFAHHGYDSHELGYEPCCEVWSLWEAPIEITAGGACECGGVTDEGYDCECDHDSFSWRSCDGCGCTLGGVRHAMTYWTGEKA